MTHAYPPLRLARDTEIASRPVALTSLPRGYAVHESVSLVGPDALRGSVVYRAAPGGTLFETRATSTPGGDILLMFPANTQEKPTGRCHYGGGAEKVNDLVAYRSSDEGFSWSGPTVAFDIDYNQHGFIPLVPRGSNRIYAFGTQPVWGLRPTEHGLRENAPIGYRYSDDDGRRWSEVRLIRPENDPGFTGMSVMRMCETDSGAWILGSHEADWSYKPLMTRQYVLRSTDQGRTWTLSPNPRHGGWCVPAFNRMDEGRPISLGGASVFMMLRTCEGHLWATRSEDDGVTWSDPAPTPLVHPDAPPMLFHLSDGKTLAAFHHNRHHDLSYTGLSGEKNALMRDRSEIWVSFSTDGGAAWSAPRFFLSNAAEPDLDRPFFNHQCSYMDMIVRGTTLHFFMPHRWQQALHLAIEERELFSLLEEKELRA